VLSTGADRAADLQDHNGVVLLSPHPDDVALSIGGLLQMSRLLPPVRIVTLFGRTNFLGTLGFQRDWEYATRRRRAEDEAFALRVGLELLYCDLPEASLRIGQSRDSIFASRSRPGAFLTDAITRTVGEIAATIRPAHILAPLGLGWHRDHLATREVAAIVASEVQACLTYYEDLPYAAMLLPSEIEGYVSELGPGLKPVIIRLGQHLGEKLSALELYTTQITDEVVELVDRYARVLNPADGAERLWASDGVAPLLDV
jgi:LmbE family N-acetylglucosaminyl deacetylase